MSMKKNRNLYAVDVAAASLWLQRGGGCYGVEMAAFNMYNTRDYMNMVWGELLIIMMENFPRSSCFDIDGTMRI